MIGKSNVVPDYDKFSLVATAVATVSTDLLYEGETGVAVIVGADYIMKADRFVVQSLATVPVTLTLLAVSTIVGLPGTIIKLAGVDIGAGANLLFSERDIEVRITSGYRLVALCSAEGGVSVTAQAHFEKGTGMVV